MSHEITSSDGLALAVQPVWHGLGVVLPEAPTIQEGFRIAGLGWRVVDQPLQRLTSIAPTSPAITPVDVPTHKALVREDTGEFFAIASDGFSVLQNSEMADLAQALAEDGTIPKAESVGSLKGGRRVWLQVKTGTFLAGERDRVMEYLLFSNAHDTSGAFRITPTTVRVVCHNTLTAALSGGKDLVRLSHTSGLKAALEAVKPRVLQALKRGAGFRDQIQTLAAQPLSADATRDYFRSVYASLWPDKVTKASEGDRAVQAELEATLRGWIGNLQSARNTDTGTEGTVWHALNAVTEWAEHERAVRVGKGEDAGQARAYSRLFGAGQDIKAAALGRALAVVGGA